MENEATMGMFECSGNLDHEIQQPHGSFPFHSSPTRMHRISQHAVQVVAVDPFHDENRVVFAIFSHQVHRWNTQVVKSAKSTLLRLRCETGAFAFGIMARFDGHLVP